jgi:hypothetical protein
MSLVSVLMGLAGPMILRILTTLGIGTLTFAGVTTSLQGLINLAIQNYAGIPGDVLALSGMAGIPQALGIIAGALTTRVGIWVAVSATRFIVGGS